MPRARRPAVCGIRLTRVLIGVVGGCLLLFGLEAIGLASIDGALARPR